MKKIILSLCLIGLIFIGQSGAGETQKPPLQVAVYPFEPVNLESSGQATVITNAVFRELVAAGMAVRDQQSTQAAIEQIGLGQSGHCSEDMCKIEAGKILKANKLVMGSIEKLEANYYTVAIRVVDIQTGKTEFSVTDDCSCERIVQVRDLAKKLTNEQIIPYLQTGKKPEVTEPQTPPPSVTPSGSITPVVAPAGTGTLVVDSSPRGAEIMLDGASKGKTPQTIPGVSAGSHIFTIYLDGYTTVTKGVKVAANSTSRLNEILVQLTGGIDVKSTPGGAYIYIDNKPVGQTPKTIQGVGVGRHSVKVILPPDYADYTTEVSVEANDIASLNAQLQGKPGKIQITSMPGGAEVYIDGSKAGVTIYSGELSPGSHIIKVGKQEYQSEEKTVTIIPNKLETWDVILKNIEITKPTTSSSTEIPTPASFKQKPRKPEEIMFIAATKEQQISCPTDMIFIPSGWFMMGCNSTVDDKCRSDENPFHMVYLDSFCIDKYEVTVKEYKDCLQANKCTTIEVHISPSYQNSEAYCSLKESGQDNLPRNCIEWTQAKTYCDSVGKRLPTEAEWEKAARGTDGRKYPWGNEQASCDYSVMKSGGEGCGKKSTWPAGSIPKGDSPYGVCDMAGNISEWVADWYDRKYYQTGIDKNPVGPLSGNTRILKGGSYGGGSDSLRVSSRYYARPDYMLSTVRNNDIRDYGFDRVGFRCVKIP